MGGINGFSPIRLLNTTKELPDLALKAITLERLSADSGVLMC
jgi:hypothetical protein